MNMPHVGKALVVAAFATFAASSAFAATQGTLGPNSQGSLNITLTIDPIVQISALDDIPLGTYTGGGPMSGADNLCVYSNNGGYDITATGNGAGQAFELIGISSAATIPYTVEWATSAGAGSGSPLTTNVTLAGQGGTFTTPDCGGGNNAQVIVTVSDPDLAAVPADDYTGVLTLLVAPQ